nr:odorant binding protein 4 [Pagiophloeus tsushimanus]
MGAQNGHGTQNNQYGRNGNQNGRPSNGYENSFGADSMYGSNNNQESYGFRSPNRGYQTSSTNNYDIRSLDGPSRGLNRDNLPNSDCNNNGNEGSGTNMYAYNPGMPFGFNNHQSRYKRFNYFNRDENKENENNQCVSQCVLAYLHLLDDDRTPSESMVIKWLQEHVTGNDMDRIKALRDARRCFARLTTTDIDDGCEFSKELSKCLELDLE